VSPGRDSDEDLKREGRAIRKRAANARCTSATRNDADRRRTDGEKAIENERREKSHGPGTASTHLEERGENTDTNLSMAHCLNSGGQGRSEEISEKKVKTTRGPVARLPTTVLLEYPKSGGRVEQRRKGGTNRVRGTRGTEEEGSYESSRGRTWTNRVGNARGTEEEGKCRSRSARCSADWSESRDLV
jgi:hypothetical protein